ncbi:hypothetical protein SAMN02745751_03383 [Dethiosulfatibacter aminovorans DSM 17477]|uniref:Oligosaccharide repeat unit polymerase n=1 Tax=Dethiosulfatibacter aminovorans DSM 17477 TaxID=1121476 RepID=A0A1M6M6W9_9FIRM|nr:hypothetical protein [Dethiosulfatibacter aminovorans]SHJ79209.1 hypothetical protein SAMN02745751_03383 [Dethiosulfatibacter aminovorans DSM 17477]
MTKIYKPTNELLGLYVICVASIFSAIVVLMETISVEGYRLLFLLPSSYLFFVVFNCNKIKYLKSNIGLLMLFAVEFIRLVVNPLLIAFSEYKFSITINTAENTPMAVLLLVYETIAISLAMRVRIKRDFISKQYSEHGMKRMTFAVFAVLLISIVVFSFAPEVINNNVTLLNLFQENGRFANAEQTWIISKYGTSFLKKLMLVLANYILNVDKLLIPAYIIVAISKFKYAKPIALAATMLPFLLIDGVIARSFINCIILLLLFFGLYKIDVKRMYKPFILVAVVVVFYFYYRFSLLYSDRNLSSYFASITNSYFSGVNIVSGAFNMTGSIVSRAYYCIRDYLGSIPFSSTLFGLHGKTVSEFFNACNDSGGQIPTTVGLCMYYFTPIFSPLYSVIFTRKCFVFGEYAKLEENPFFKVIYIFMTIYLALGISMYNVTIVFGYMIQVALPIYIIVWWAYKRRGVKV